MNDADLEYGPTPADAEYEHTDIEPSIAGKFAVWLTVAMVISVAIVYGTFWFFEGREQTAGQASQQFPLAAGQVREPPGPQLQTQPFKDIYLLRQSENEKLTSLRLGRPGRRRRPHPDRRRDAHSERARRDPLDVGSADRADPGGAGFIGGADDRRRGNEGKTTPVEAVFRPA